MLLHHFGSRDELLLAVVDEVERRQMAVMRELPPDPGDAIAAMWANLRRPELRPFERLFFECYARGVQGEQPFARMVPGAVESWLSDDAATAIDPAMMRLGLAVSRGLLLDLVATEDSDGVDAAAQAFVDLGTSTARGLGALRRRVIHRCSGGPPLTSTLVANCRGAGADRRGFKMKGTVRKYVDGCRFMFRLHFGAAALGAGAGVMRTPRP